MTSGVLETAQQWRRWGAQRILPHTLLEVIRRSDSLAPLAHPGTERVLWQCVASG